MFENFGKNTIRLFFAEYNEKPVAAVMIHMYKDMCFYWGGCSYSEALKLKANNYLLYQTMLSLKNSGKKIFAVGLFQSFPGKNTKEYTVGQYKAQFVRDYYTAFEGVKTY